MLRDDIRDSLDLSIYYNVSEVAWARTSFIQPQLMIHDRFLYDRERGEWTVGKYLEDVRRRYGGIDSVLLWASYPNIGVDDRNQFDMLEDLPGGLEGLKTCIEDFHAEGVKVLLPYNPWDQGTRSDRTQSCLALMSCKGTSAFRTMKSWWIRSSSPRLTGSMETCWTVSTRPTGRRDSGEVTRS